MNRFENRVALVTGGAQASVLHPCVVSLLIVMVADLDGEGAEQLAVELDND